MQDRDLYARILGLVDPWEVRDVKLDVAGGEVRVTVAAKPGVQMPCPECGKACPGYDVRERSWRHLDTCQFKTILVADVARVNCAEHGVKQIRVPWAEPGSGFTALMEAVVIDWLRSLASIKAVAEQLRLSWDQVDGIMARAVARGLLRRQAVSVSRLGVDETSFQRRHEYVTIVTDLDGSVVLHVADDRRRESLDAFFRSLTAEQLGAIEVVAMDMWGPFISSASKHVPDAGRKIAFDKFHVAGHLGEAVDRVRRREHKALLELGDDSLKGSRYIWLTNPGNLDAAGTGALNALHQMNLKTSRAWALKETAMCIWRFVQRGRALKEWTAWLSKAMRSRLDPVKKVARMIRKHLWGIVNAMALRTTNAGSESVNAKVQRVKRTACGFRNRERFRNAILFHLGGLDLYPAHASATHTDS
ncbi:MAG: ISL3 family transposase [Polyangiaceae bacterium]|jgi:transposase